MDMDTSSIIDRLGGTVSTARLCGVSSPAVSVWRQNGIPPMYWPLITRHAEAENIPGITWDTIEAARRMARGVV